MIEKCVMKIPISSDKDSANAIFELVGRNVDYQFINFDPSVSDIVSFSPNVLS